MYLRFGPIYDPSERKIGLQSLEQNAASLSEALGGILTDVLKLAESSISVEVKAWLKNLALSTPLSNISHRDLNNGGSLRGRKCSSSPKPATEDCLVGLPSVFASVTNVPVKSQENKLPICHIGSLFVFLDYNVVRVKMAALIMRNTKKLAR